MTDNTPTPAPGQVATDERLRKENDVLRGLVATLKISCIYCGIKNMAECAIGFPGCARADDLMAGEDEIFRTQAETIRKLTADLGLTRKALDIARDMLEEHNEAEVSSSAEKDKRIAELEADRQKRLDGVICRECQKHGVNVDFGQRYRCASCDSVIVR